MDSKYFLVVCVLFWSSLTLADEGCDKSKCPGPHRLYNELDCKPVYKTPESCCPYKYDCDHWKNRPADKCFVNGHEYNIGDKLKNEDEGPCDHECICSEYKDMAKFMCAEINCPIEKFNSSCYNQQKANECCEGPTICFEKPEDRATCMDGKYKYYDGEMFEPESNPELNCFCGPGYTGENIEPWCVSKKKFCQPQLRQAYEIRNKCVPVFARGQVVQKACAFQYRCQKPQDVLIPNTDKKKENDEMNDMKCVFGDMIMNYGDEISQGEDHESKCVKCVCEVGPIPTCHRLPKEQCEADKSS